jgi:hypothetical protein
MKIDVEEAEVRIAEVLKAAGIKAELKCCSCCCVFEVEFPDGAKAVGWRGFEIICDGIEHQRNG